MKRKDFVAKMKDILRKRRDALRNVLQGELTELTGRDSGVGDAIDFASDSDSDEISSQLAVVESRELESIEYALDRLRRGRYGVCESCDASIPTARLQALPYTTHCIQCQRHSEQRQRTESRRFDWPTTGEESDEDSQSIDRLEMEAN